MVRVICCLVLLVVHAMWVRGQVASETTVAGPDDGETHDIHGDQVGLEPEEDGGELLDVVGDHVLGADVVVLQGNDGTLANAVRKTSTVGVHVDVTQVFATETELGGDTTAGSGKLGVLPAEGDAHGALHLCNFDDKIKKIEMS